MGKASLASSIINLVKSAVGAGILGVPYVFGQMGLALGAGALVLTAIIQTFALHLLALAALQAHNKGQDASFPSLSQIAFGGRKHANAVTSVSVILVAWMAAVAYMIIIGDLVPEVAEYLEIENRSFKSRGFWITGIGFAIELPLSFLPNVDSLKFSSMIGTIGIMYVVITICLLAGGIVAVPPAAHPATMWPPPPSAYTSRTGIVESLPIFIVAFGCAKNVPAVALELKENTVRRVDAVLISTIAICTVFYMVVGVCGSLALGASVQGNALKSFPNEPGTTGGLVSLFGRVAVVVNVMGTVPLCMHPLKEVTCLMFFGKVPSQLTFPTRASVTLSIFITIYGMAMLIPDLDKVLSLMGSTAEMLVGFSLPAFFFYYGVSRGSSTEDGNFGVSLQDTAHQSNTKDGPLRKSAWLLGWTGVALIPPLAAVLVWKMIKDELA
jgi:amino acid permease